MIYRPGEIEHRRAARRQQRLPELARRAAQLREVSAVGRVVSVDRHDGERMRLTKNSARYEHVLAHDLWVSIETALAQEQFAPRETASKPLFQNDHSLLDTQSRLSLHSPNQRLGTSLCSPCATTHIPQVQLDRVLFCECDHRADKLIGLKVDVSGEFITEFELVFVQEP